MLDNPTHFRNPFQFEITFECLQELDDDLEWKVVYVGSAEDSTHDQILEEVLVGPVPVGVNKFVLQTDAADPATIPKENILGVTVVLVTCSYKNQEFARIGYYVNNEMELPPGTPVDESGKPIEDIPIDYSKLMRQILADKPRVTRFPIDWSGAGDQQISATTTATTEDQQKVAAFEEEVDNGDNGEAEMDETFLDEDDEDDDEDGEMDLGDEDDGDMIDEIPSKSDNVQDIDVMTAE